MAQKRSLRVKKEKPPKQQNKPEPKSTLEAEEKPFDFGGLPDRDIKKSLGCGG